MFFAYLDAGSGSLIIQAVLGGIAGVVVAGRAWKARLFGNRAESAEQPANESATDEALKDA